MSSTFDPPDDSSDDDSDYEAGEESSSSLSSDVSGGEFGQAVQKRQHRHQQQHQSSMQFKPHWYGIESDTENSIDDIVVVGGASRPASVHAALRKVEGVHWKWDNASDADVCKSTNTLVVGFAGPGEHSLEAVFPIKRHVGQLVVPSVPYLYGEPSSVAGVRKSGPSSSTACDLYNVDDGSACMLLLCRGAIPIERASDFSSKLFSKINAKSVVALESLRLANYLTDRSADHEVLPPLLRVLQTSAAGGQAIAPPLEAPNVIEGAGAAVLTHCQIHSIPGRLFLSLLESHDGNSVMTLDSLKALEPALLCLPVQHKDDMAAHLQDYFRKWVRNAPRKVHNPLFA